MTEKKTDLSPQYKSGWLLCRMATLDDSEGYTDDAPGVFIRVRIAEITVYIQATQSVVELHMRGEDAPLAIWATVDQVDKIIARETVKTVHNG